MSIIGSTPASALKKIETQKPDLEEIRKRVTDRNNKYYYPKLRQLYDRNDTVMTPEEYRYYYLGYLFQEDFNPYRTSEFSEVTDSLTSKDKHSKQECDTIIKYAELSLEDNPFDLKQMSFLIYALKEKGKVMRAKIWQYRLENILGAIRSTGTGEDADNAWFVISPSHEYALINALNFTAVGYTEAAPGIDLISVEYADKKPRRASEKTPKAFYFNVKNLQEEYDRKFPEEYSEESISIGEMPLQEDSEPDTEELSDESTEQSSYQQEEESNPLIE